MIAGIAVILTSIYLLFGFRVFAFSLLISGVVFLVESEI
jgi:hypothetical protein